MPPATLYTSLNPRCLSMLVPRLERWPVLQMTATGLRGLISLYRVRSSGTGILSAPLICDDSNSCCARTSTSVNDSALFVFLHPAPQQTAAARALRVGLPLPIHTYRHQDTRSTRSRPTRLSQQHSFLLPGRLFLLPGEYLAAAGESSRQRWKNSSRNQYGMLPEHARRQKESIRPQSSTRVFFSVVLFC